jgi:hypothetical protein
VIKDGYNGRLVAVEDIPRIPEFINELLSSPEQCTRLRRGAREWALRELRTWTERIDFEVSWIEQRLAKCSNRTEPRPYVSEG